MRPPGRRRLTAALATIALLLAAACAAPNSTAPTSSAPVASTTSTTPAAGPVTATLKEWAIEVSAPTAKAGTVVFNVRNEGKVPHDLVVIRTDLAPGALPTASGLIEETKLSIVGRTEQLTPGDGKRLTVELPAGKYVLVCNVIGHYNSGQFAALTVQ
ncbi:MAG: sulfocyanin-like copper-binding protein [Chloroflexota bacterium]